MQERHKSADGRAYHHSCCWGYLGWPRSRSSSFVSGFCISFGLVDPRLSRYGADGVWVGTRFVASEEAGAAPKHKELVLLAGYDDTVRTLIYSGRPMSVRRTPYVAEWESQRQPEIETIVSQGKIPHEVELEKHPEKSIEGRMCKTMISAASAFFSDRIPIRADG